MVVIILEIGAGLAAHHIAIKAFSHTSDCLVTMHTAAIVSFQFAVIRNSPVIIFTHVELYSVCTARFSTRTDFIRIQDTFCSFRI